MGGGEGGDVVMLLRGNDARDEDRIRSDRMKFFVVGVVVVVAPERRDTERGDGRDLGPPPPPQ